MNEVIESFKSGDDRSIEMWSLEFSQCDVSLAHQYDHCGHHQYEDQDDVVEVFRDHIKGLIWCSPDEEIIHAEAKHEDGGLHIGGSKSEVADVVEGDVVAEVGGRTEGQEVVVLWEFLVREEAFRFLLGSACAHEIPVDGVEFIFPRDHEDVSAGQRHLGFTHVHFFYRYR
jgi:hypothetical protein